MLKLTLLQYFQRVVRRADKQKDKGSLESEEIVCPTEYYYRIGRKATNKRPDNPYRWDQVTVRHILENRLKQRKTVQPSRVTPYPA